MRDALRLAELRFLKLQALHEQVRKARESGGSYSDEEIAAALTAETE